MQQLNDSSLIISALESFLVDRSVPIDELVSFYPELETQNSRAKTVYEHPNKYFVMYGDRKTVPPYREFVPTFYFKIIHGILVIYGLYCKITDMLFNFNHLTAMIQGSGYKLFVKWRHYPEAWLERYLQNGAGIRGAGYNTTCKMAPLSGWSALHKIEKKILFLIISMVLL